MLTEAREEDREYFSSARKITMVPKEGSHSPSSGLRRSAKGRWQAKGSISAERARRDHAGNNLLRGGETAPKTQTLRHKGKPPPKTHQGKKKRGQVKKRQSVETGCSPARPRSAGAAPIQAKNAGHQKGERETPSRDTDIGGKIRTRIRERRRVSRTLRHRADERNETRNRDSSKRQGLKCAREAGRQ